MLWTERKIHLGNFLYHWMRAYTRQEEGARVYALRTPEMGPWLDAFPTLADRLLVSRGEVRLTDRREVGFFQAWGIDYTPEELERFAGALLQDATLPLARRSDADQRIVLNVRRGDYFGTYADRYAFNQIAYLRLALDRALLLGGPADTVHVVSDDIMWCRDNLQWITESVDELRFSSPEPTPHDDFVQLATARRLILTTTSFGYWGAHLSNALYGDNEDLVVVPWFHVRRVWSGASYLLNPAWSVVRRIPGGW